VRGICDEHDRSSSQEAHDLPSLSSVQRALSFLAVGAVLLLGGFFYQRLSAQFDER
jgi:uncharacterized membrane protein